MAEQILDVWKVVIWDEFGREAAELTTEPDASPGESFTVAWDSAGTVRFDLATPSADGS